jgi:ribulose-5-phosphate 4-epimerase/fuculose-1-phosphate aldolase
MESTTMQTEAVRREMDLAHAQDERQLRIDLAAAFRATAQFNWHESVGNHLSVALSDDGKQFLMNPRWRHFSTISASELLKLDSNDPSTMDGPNAPDPSAWAIHSQIHARVPHARCILHLHTPYASALTTLSDPTLKPIDQNTARFYERLAVDLDYGGIADSWEEGARLADKLGEHRVLMMGNHGVLVVGDSVHRAFEDIYFLERASQTMVLAYSTGQPLNVMPHALALQTARDWDAYSGMAIAHFEEIKRGLDKSDPSYKS